MKTDTVIYRKQQASCEAIRVHLHACSSHFVPPLAARVDIDAYAEKIVRRAHTFEAWQGDVLAGLLAAYLDGGVDGAGFITNVSVLPGLTGQGIASRLLAQCVELARSGGLAAIELEVGAGNSAAQAFYRHHGFAVTATQHDSLRMRLPLPATGECDDRRPQ